LKRAAEARAEATERKRNGLPAGCDCCGLVEGLRINLAVDQSFDPIALRIDDLKQDVLCLHDLARRSLRGCDHAIGWCSQEFRFGARIADNLAARRKPQAPSASETWLEGTAPRSASGRKRRTLASATAMSCSISPVFSRIVVRSARRQVRVDFRKNIAFAHLLSDAG
jgi:hypothetical protein